MNTNLELEIIDRIKAVLGTRIKTVETLPGEWEEELLRKLLRVAPVAYVAFAGGQAIEGAVLQIDSRWVVYVATTHAGGRDQRVRGDGREVGGYELLNELVAGLHNWQPEHGGTMSLQRIDALGRMSLDTKGIQLYGSVWISRCTVLAVTDDEALSGVDLTYDLAPADEQVDATDVVNLETA